MAQYIVNGSATRNSCNCYTLTTEAQFQSGSVWNSNKIDLRNPFDFWFNIFLGCSDRGADGMVFILQPISTSIGTSGEGMGFEGVKPSIGIALDTYQNMNQNDPAYDHISIQANGVIHHASDLVGPVPISAISNNVEDCQWHKLRITWDPSTGWLRSYFDGILRVEKQINLAGTIFNNDPMVYWGFTGATGGEFNQQRFCTAVDPDFSTTFPAGAACAPATLNFTNQSVSFAPITEFNWDFGNGNRSTLENPPAQLYSDTGTYQVKLKIKGMDGCENEISRNIIIGSVPVAMLHVSDACEGEVPEIRYSTANVGVRYQWSLDGGAWQNSQPALGDLQPGAHELQLLVTSDLGCEPSATATHRFTIRPAPQVRIETQQECRTVQFSITQTDGATTISNLRWTFGDTQSSSEVQPVHVYAAPGNYTAGVVATASNGCTSDAAEILITAPEAIAHAGRDTVVIKDLPFILNGSGNGAFAWSPATGIDNPFAANPSVTLSEDQQLVLTVTTDEGCIAMDTVSIKVMKGPAVYVPSAFTPNGDGRNDVLRPVYVGIQKIDQFIIFNRWGQQVFASSHPGVGWDGTLNGKEQNGTFIWYIKATNHLNEPLLLKGSVTIIR